MHNKFPDDLKEQVLNEFDKKEMRRSEIVDCFGISISTLEKWVRDRKTPTSFETASVSGKSSLEEENKKLKKIISMLLES